MRTKKIVAILMVATLALGALALAGCASKGKSITGEWSMQNNPGVTYVITDTAITAPTGEIPYTLGDDNKITLFAGTENESVAKYELSDDGKTLTIIETFNNGEATGTPQEIKTVFTKISDNKDATPSGGSAETSATNK